MCVVVVLVWLANLVSDRVIVMVFIVSVGVSACVSASVSASVSV